MDGTAFDWVHRRTRRVWLLIGALAAGVVAAVALLIAHANTPATAGDLLLVYVGAEDCAPCRAWQRGDGAGFRRSVEFPRIRYREVKSPRLHDLLDDAHWPDELRSYRSRLKRSDGVPLWLVISDDVVVAQHFGAEAWQSNVLPALKSRLR